MMKKPSLHPLPRQKLKAFSINRLIPNLLTLLALSAGLSGIRFALSDKWEAAVVAIGVAAVFDTLDGRIARILDATSKFGAELDSLSDFLSFGVAPVFILYMWSLHNIGGVGWALTVIYAICTALRLARFNTKIENADIPSWAGRFFTGVPAPAGAGLVLLPLIFWLEYGGWFFSSPLFVGFVVLGVAALLVSRIPTYSFKRMKINPANVLPVMLVFALFASFLVSTPWNTLMIVLIVYLATIPFSYQTHKRLVQGVDVGNEEDHDTGHDTGNDRTRIDV